MNIVRREDWGAAPPKGRFTRMVAPSGVVIHHSAGRRRDLAAVLSIQRSHHDRRWIDIGYNFLITEDAQVVEGRPELDGSPVIGAHAPGMNSKRIGVCLLGDFREMRDRPDFAQISAVVELCQWAAVRYGIHPMHISAHRDHRSTKCPGDRLYRLMSHIREMAARPFETKIQVA